MEKRQSGHPAATLLIGESLRSVPALANPPPLPRSQVREVRDAEEGEDGQVDDEGDAVDLPAEHVHVTGGEGQAEAAQADLDDGVAGGGEGRFTTLNYLCTRF